MPTRTDAQGLMMCEMAAMEYLLLLQRYPVCHEIFDGLNAYLLSNIENRNLNKYLDFNTKCRKDVRFYKKYVEQRVKNNQEYMSILRRI